MSSVFYTKKLLDVLYQQATIYKYKNLVRSEGFEPPTSRIGICCDIQLRHERTNKKYSEFKNIIIINNKKWRREGDSNPRSRFNDLHDFQSCSLNQLGHLSTRLLSDFTIAYEYKKYNTIFWNLKTSNFIFHFCFYF